MKLTSLAIAVATTALLIGGAALAQTAAPAPAAPAMAAPAAAAPSAKSVECSKEADAKGLHGEARRKFRAECKRGK